MNAAKRKLQSRQGASMLMALLLMLVALMVSAVILSAAISAVVDLRAQKESQQAYLTASSAAQLFRDSVLDKAGQYTQVSTTVYTIKADSTQEVIKQKDKEITAKPAGPYAPVMEDALTQILKNGFTRVHNVYLVEAEGYDPVDLDFTMVPVQENATITGVKILATFAAATTNGHPCQVTLTMTAGLNSNTTDNTDGNTRTYTLSESLVWDPNQAILQTPKTGTEAKP